MSQIKHIPTLEYIQALHEMHAPNKELLEKVWEHSLIVEAIVKQLAHNKPNIDTNLARAGALLHDIGVYKLHDTNGSPKEPKQYIMHGLLGYRLLQEEGFEETLCRFSLLHTGVGITKEDISTQSLPLPPRDYVAETTEERLVMYADKFHSKTPAFNTLGWYRHYLTEKFGKHKRLLFDELVDEFGEPQLSALVARYEQPIRKV